MKFGIQKPIFTPLPVLFPAQRILYCIFDAPNGTRLNVYPWTGVGEVRPGNNQWVDVVTDDYYAWPAMGYTPDTFPVGASFAARMIVQDGKATGNITRPPATDPLMINSTGVARINLGAPMRKVSAVLQNARVDGKVSTQVVFRLASGVVEHTKIHDFWSVQHSVQLLRNYGTPTDGDPAIHFMNLWGGGGGGYLLAQAIIKTELLWTPNTPYTAYNASSRTVGPYFVGQSVQPTVSNGFQYICVTGGTSHASIEPSWPVVAGQTVIESTGVKWRCEKNVNYQTTPQTLVINDTGSLIQVDFGGVTLQATDPTNNKNSWMGIVAGAYGGSDCKYSNLEAWT